MLRPWAVDRLEATFVAFGFILIFFIIGVAL